MHDPLPAFLPGFLFDSVRPTHLRLSEHHRGFGLVVHGGERLLL